MCKAIEYSKQLIEIYNNIQDDFKVLSEELSSKDLYEQDILHTIEAGGFNAAQGYMLAKMIYDNRVDRRKIKNELDPLLKLKTTFIDRNMGQLKQTTKSIENRAEILQKCTENKIYHNRIDSNGMSKPQRTRWLRENFNPNAIITTDSSINGHRVCILGEIDNKYYDAIVKDCTGGYNRQKVLKSKIKML